MDSNNLVRFGEKGIYANNFELSKAKQHQNTSQSEQQMLLWQLTSKILK
jgi:hypothetical protein